MASAPKADTPLSASAENVEQRFRQLDATWTAETGYQSSYTGIVEQPAFRKIIGLGPTVVPFMVRDLEDRPRLANGYQW